ncbi:MAG: AsmA-like C-terminal region-containing protein, partial [Pseudomonadota bacterium]
RVTDGIALHGFSGRVTAGQGLSGRFEGRVNDGAAMTGVLRPGPTVYLQARDGGAALRDAGLYDNIRGGTLRVSLSQLADGVFDGRFSLQSSRLVNAPVVAEILAAANPISLIDRLAGKGIGFDDAQGWFTLARDRITIARARAVGPALGLTLSGDFAPTTGRVALQGVVSPLYTLNGLPARIPLLGRLIGGRAGEGVFGITFQVGGRARAPDIAINPLSLLTPGAAREIFMTRQALDPVFPAAE